MLEIQQPIDLSQYSPFIEPVEIKKRDEEKERILNQELQKEFSKQYGELKASSMDNILGEYYKEKWPLFSHLILENERKLSPYPAKVLYRTSGDLVVRLGTLSMNAGDGAMPYQQLKGKMQYINLMPEVDAKELDRWYKAHLDKQLKDHKIDQKQIDFRSQSIKSSMEIMRTKLNQENATI